MAVELVDAIDQHRPLDAAMADDLDRVVAAVGRRQRLAQPVMVPFVLDALDQPMRLGLDRKRIASVPAAMKMAEQLAPAARAGPARHGVHAGKTEAADLDRL